MKTIKTIILLLAFVSVQLPLVAQKESNKKHLIESENLVGVWNMTGGVTTDGGIVNVRTENYKILNADGTFLVYVFNQIVNPAMEINLYGSYSIDSDSTYTEHIVKSRVSSMSGTKSMMKYKLMGKDRLLIQYYNEAVKVWVPEIWTRVSLGKIMNDKKTI